MFITKSANSGCEFSAVLSSLSSVAWGRHLASWEIDCRKNCPATGPEPLVSADGRKHAGASLRRRDTNHSQESQQAPGNLFTLCHSHDLRSLCHVWFCQPSI